MKRVLFFWIILLFAGCRTPEQQPERKPDLLCSSIWYFPQAPVPVFINFTPDGRVIGSIGHERFFAPVSYHPDGSFQIDSFAVSQVGTPPEFEKPFLEALKKAEYRRPKDGKMELFDKQGDLVMVLTPAPRGNGK